MGRRVFPQIRQALHLSCVHNYHVPGLASRNAKRVTRLWTNLAKEATADNNRGPVYGECDYCVPQSRSRPETPDTRLLIVPDGFAVIDPYWEAKPLPAIVRDPHVP